jgi:RNA polymerase sigma-70 factor (ECF subfamily)
MARFTDGQIEQWHARLFRTALRLTGSHDAASDLAQEALCKAVGKWDQFDGRSLPTTWLHRILVNCVNDWRRREAANPAGPLDEWALMQVQDKTGDAGQAFDLREGVDSLRHAIDELPVTLRAAFVITMMDGYTYEEAAELLSVPVGTIGSRVYEARKKLKAIMQDCRSVEHD